MVGGALFVLSWKLSLWESYLCFNPQGERIFRIPRLVFWLFWNFTGERAPSRTQCWHQGSWQLGIRVPCCSCAAFFIHIKWGRSRSHSKCGHSDEHTPPFGSTRQIWNHLFGMNHRMWSYFSLPRAWPIYIKISKHSVNGDPFMQWSWLSRLPEVAPDVVAGVPATKRRSANVIASGSSSTVFCGETKPYEPRNCDAQCLSKT